MAYVKPRRGKPFKHWLDDWPRMARQIGPVKVAARPNSWAYFGAETWDEVHRDAAHSMAYTDQQTEHRLKGYPDDGYEGFAFNP